MPGPQNKLEAPMEIPSRDSKMMLLAEWFSNRDAAVAN